VSSTTCPPDVDSPRQSDLFPWLREAEFAQGDLPDKMHAALIAYARRPHRRRDRARRRRNRGAREVRSPFPWMTMTSARIAYLYDPMNATYDVAAIHDHGKALGHMPIIDRNFRAQHEAKAEWAREVERLKLIRMPDPRRHNTNF
jgi:hypothetical protein